MINTAILEYGVKRVLTRRTQTYQEVSDKHWILCPQEITVSPTAIYLDGALDKVLAVQEETSYDYEMKRIGETQKEHAATIAYQIRDAHLLNGHMYKGGMKHALVTTKKSLLSSSLTDYIPKAAIACTACGNRYFGHWMTDDLTLTLAARQLAEPITVARKPYSHEPEYLHLFGIQARALAQAKCSELIIIEDIGQNKFKRERYDFLRSRLKMLEPVHQSYGVMIRRGASGVNRVLINEAEIEEFLATQGFTIIDPQSLSVTEIVRQALGAKVVVGVEGSHLLHGFFCMADRGTILTLQPPYRFNNSLKDYTDCLDMRYGFVVGKPVPGGFMIELEDLARTLDKIATLST